MRTAMWLGFGIAVAVLLTIDLAMHRRGRPPMSTKEAGVWSGIWIGLALAFNGVVFATMGASTGVAFTTGYLIEKSLSIDNLFVFLLIFSAVGVGASQQHRVLSWGILGALVLRGVFVAAGAALLHRFHVVIYIFGGILVLTAAKLLFVPEDADSPGREPWVVRTLKRVIPITKHGGEHFFVRERGKLHATPLFVALVAVELSDVVFAVDSVPAVFGVTDDAFIVYTSNVFAILGLRSLYLVLAKAAKKLHYLQIGLGVVLLLIGAKMIAGHWVHLPPVASLAIVLVVLGGAVVASLVRQKRLGPEKATGG